ncbi:MAG TPA: calcium/sodium antiporter [Anaerohalosphaeraceae bacterium]|nr:calcium/sodium antiporter [Phycisphaerae bacterium]HOK95365.1 calcium/sodium antiporter [Anaerohalosphaeraceae bacterium]HOL32605.1 calcium/sodium antiporter [Anaerohalosphaeraceae bacterium]HOM76111.1 calcium/sodium antiporter [Anaerohalosphaeraceae bacterium]HPC63346.1 calcium/sodium antiporter [Anaerohalosphaeraceae bacterium]
MVASLLLIFGLAGVIVGAHLLVDGASAVARRLRVSDLVIGLTVVAFGTSLPELTVNIFAVVQNQPAVAVGNITGSNIANILLILGLSSLIAPVQVGRGTVWKEIPMCLGGSIVLAFFCAAGAQLSRIEGILLLSLFLVFLAYIVGIARELPGLDNTHEHFKSVSLPAAMVMVAAGLIFLIGGGRAVVQGAVRLAAAAGLSEAFIAATVVAVGTSLPELAASVAAAVKKKPDIAVGNVVGSNIFNIFLILGISAVLRPLPIAPTLMIGLWIGILSAATLFFCMFIGKRHQLERWQGGILLILYIVYLILQAQ